MIGENMGVVVYACSEWGDEYRQAELPKTTTTTGGTGQPDCIGMPHATLIPCPLVAANMLALLRSIESRLDTIQKALEKPKRKTTSRKRKA